jgi:hypothetical protein
MDAIFHERQRFRQKWVFALPAFVLLPPIVVMLIDPRRPRPIGLLVASVIVTIALFWMLLASYLDVTVTKTEIVVRYYPFHLRPRRIALSEIAEAHARKYQPIVEYGGWGIRLGFNGWAWNVSGDEGVQLVLADGKRILIGSQRSAELERAIHSAA